MLGLIAEAIERFHASEGSFPPDLATLAADVDDVGDPYLERVPSDAWGTEFRYAPTPDAPRGDVLRSAGLDRRWDTEDDRSLAASRRRLPL